MAELSSEEFEKWARAYEPGEVDSFRLERNQVGEYYDSELRSAWAAAKHFYAAASGEALRWIPVEEKLPQNSDGVLVEYYTSGDVDVYVAHYFGGTGWFWADDTPVTKSHITRWRSIPWPAAPYSRPLTEEK